jgi:hypothetical protein
MSPLVDPQDQVDIVELRKVISGEERCKNMPMDARVGTVHVGTVSASNRRDIHDRIGWDEYGVMRTSMGGAARCSHHRCSYATCCRVHVEYALSTPSFEWADGDDVTAHIPSSNPLA